MTLEEEDRLVQYLQRDPYHARKLIRALVATRECLAGWVEIAEAHDKRDYDDEALRLAKEALNPQGSS